MSNYWEQNPYYYPQNYGLEIVAEIDFADSYEFDKVVVWRNEAGDLLWATDSGCSCPTPFENHSTLDSLERLTNWYYFEQTVKGMSRYNSRYCDDFLREVEQVYRGR